MATTTQSGIGKKPHPKHGQGKTQPTNENQQPTNIPKLTTHTIPNVIAGELTQVEKGEE